MSQAIDHFVARKAEIDELLAALAAHSEDHFGIMPDAVNWGHVTPLVDASALLARALTALGGRK